MSNTTTKIFTLQEANSRLPLVRVIAADMVTLSRELIERRRRLESIMSGREVGEGDPYGDEVAQIEEQLEKDARRLQEFVDEITDLGAEPKDLAEGLVDFPAMMDGQLVYLCWKFDEPEVLFWHELEAGFAGRQPIGERQEGADSPFGE